MAPAMPGGALAAPLDIDFTLSQSLTGVFESDAAWGDFDGDGDLDLVLCGESDTGLVTRTYENRNDTLVVRQDVIGIDNTGSGCLAWGDYDGDGDLDLALAGTAGAGPVARVFRNSGSGSLAWDPAQTLAGVSHASVAWGDHDGDGDLDLVVMGHDGVAATTTLYLNDPLGTLAPDPTNTLAGLYAGSADWADWNRDGDLDLLLTGNDGSARRVIFYENLGFGTLADHGTRGLPGIALSDAAFGDVDADGDLDLAYTGEAANPTTRMARVYTNNGGGAFTQVADVLSIYRSSCALGDYDNDGDLDVAFCGYTGTSLRGQIFENTPTGFAPTSYALEAVREGSLTWADVDDDGRLDLFLTGADWGAKHALLYTNGGGTANTRPRAPSFLTGLQVQPTIGFPSPLTLTWSGAADAETPAAGLTYCLRVGTTAGGNDIVPGTYGSPLMGNVGQATTVRLPVPAATYYWSVRSIDSGFMASAWAPEQVSVPVEGHFEEVAACDDAFVDNATPTVPWGSQLPSYLYVGDRTGTPSICRTYVKFNLGGIPANATVWYATMHLTRFGGSTGTYYIDTWHELLDNWDENTITWNNAPALFASAPSSCVRVTASTGPCCWDVTSNVRGEVDGFLTEVLRGASPPEGTPLVLAEFWSQEAQMGPAQKPYLQVWYTTTTGVPDGGRASVTAAPARFLEPNVPNPFCPLTTITYMLPEAGMTRLAVYEAGGRRVRELMAAAEAPGHHMVVWDGRDDHGRPVASGVYFYRLEMPGVAETRRMVLAR
jgi:hypothetical protein